MKKMIFYISSIVINYIFSFSSQNIPLRRYYFKTVPKNFQKFSNFCLQDRICLRYLIFLPANFDDTWQLLFKTPSSRIKHSKIQSSEIASQKIQFIISIHHRISHLSNADESVCRSRFSISLCFSRVYITEQQHTAIYNFFSFIKVYIEKFDSSRYVGRLYEYHVLP